MEDKLKSLTIFKNKLEEYIEIASDLEDYEKTLENKDLKLLNAELIKLLTQNEDIIFSKGRLGSTSLTVPEGNLGNIYYAILGNIYIYNLKQHGYQVIQDLFYIISKAECSEESSNEVVYKLTKLDKFNITNLLSLKRNGLDEKELKEGINAALSMENNELADFINKVLSAWENDWGHSKTNIEKDLFDYCKKLVNKLIVNDGLDLGIESKVSKDDFWILFKEELINVSQELFNDTHYSNSVFEGTKLLNNKVKEIVKISTGNEFDGVDLMNRAFSLKNPIIILGELDTDTGKNLQQGYMDIYRGTISAIRNPKGHETITITKERAIHFLFLINLLLIKLDETTV